MYSNCFLQLNFAVFWYDIYAFGYTGCDFTHIHMKINKISATTHLIIWIYYRDNYRIVMQLS